MLTVEAAWARATPPGAPTGAAYFVVDNPGDGDRLVSVSTPVAERAELHRSVEAEGSSRMEHLSEVDIPAGDRVRFAPRGYHVMLMELGAPLDEGARFPLTLSFERAGDMTVEVEVEAIRHIGGDEHH